jgi:hypothetical protein
MTVFEEVPHQFGPIVLHDDRPASSCKKHPFCCSLLFTAKLMDASVSRLADRYADNLVAAQQADAVGANRPEEVDVDALFDELENEDDGALRERRLAQLQRE